MAYRIVISLVEMKHILEVLDRRKIIESSDLIEQEDYLFIRKGDEQYVTEYFLGMEDFI